MKKLSLLILTCMTLMTIVAVVPAAASTSDDAVRPAADGWVIGPSRGPVLLIETTSSVVQLALNDLGVAFDLFEGADFSAIDLSGYDHVFVAMDGGAVEASSIANVANFVYGGGLLHFYGGTCWQDYALAVNSYLLVNDTDDYCWAISSTPNSTVVAPNHYLATSLPGVYNFVNASAAYYSLRSTDSNTWVAAVNGDGFDHLLSRPLGNGNFDICINSASGSYYTDPADFAWARQVVANMLAFAMPTLESVTDVPDDQGLQVRLEILRSDLDRPNYGIPIVQYEVYRQVPPGAVAGGQPDNGDTPVSERIEGWDFVGSLPAHGEPAYSMVVPTLVDQVLTVYFVRAATTLPWVFFDSPPNLGFSVDNIVPPPPSGFAVAYSPNNELTWDESDAPDFAWFDVHRGTTPDFVPNDGNRVHQTQALGWTDPDGTWGDYYKLIAVDDAGNKSDAAMPVLVTGVEGAAIQARTALIGNAPNPFNPATVIHFSVDRDGPVQLQIMDLRGRLVATLIDDTLVRGAHETRWNGLDASGREMPSGVYLARLVAGGTVDRSRMMLVR